MMIRLSLSILISLISINLFSIELSRAKINRISKHVEKEFGIPGLRYSPVILEERKPERLPWRFDGNSLYRIYHGQKLIGFLVIEQAKGRYDFFDFILIYDEGLKLIDAKVITYRSQHGGQITSEKWLKAFEGKKAGHRYKMNADIDAISGATLSTRSMLRAVNLIGQSLLEASESLSE